MRNPQSWQAREKFPKNESKWGISLALRTGKLTPKRLIYAHNYARMTSHLGHASGARFIHLAKYKNKNEGQSICLDLCENRMHWDFYSFFV